jgi:hypothetical protein
MGPIGCPEISITSDQRCVNIPEVPILAIALIYSSLLKGNMFAGSSSAANERFRKQ